MQKKLLQWLELCGLSATVEVFPPRTSFQFPNNKILFLISGTMHLETISNNKKIITYLNAQYLLNLEHFLYGHATKYALISDTSIRVILLSQKDFHLLIKEKPSFIEWLLTSNAEISAKMITEFSKKHESPFYKIQDSLITLAKANIIKPVLFMPEWLFLPKFITRTDLANYCQVSRKTLQLEIEKLQKRESIKIENNQFFIHQSFFLKDT
ncbi:hypothetical protein ACSMFR_11655 [Listeria aquatica]|uniref:hypothetical protein n=1 Tax=Listeria aquatica TaxID=1494960 RepID=UPI003F6F45D6